MQFARNFVYGYMIFILLIVQEMTTEMQNAKWELVKYRLMHTIVNRVIERGLQT